MIKKHLNSILIAGLFLFILYYSPAYAFDDNAHFPTILTNKAIDEWKKPDLAVKRSKIMFKGMGRQISGLLVMPSDAGKDKKYPGILFLQDTGDSPDLWLDRMVKLAGKGYVVIATNYKTTQDAEITFYQLMKLNMVDRSKLGVIGVFEGVSNTVSLAVDLKDYVKCITTVSGRPPYEINGENPADLLSVPILLIHGAIDSQVPVSVSQYLYYNLKDLDKPAKIFVMDNTRHFFSDAEWYQAQDVFVKFFDQYLKGIKVEDDKKEEKK